MVISRQRPGTAKGFVFLSLEDETGVSNVILTPALFESERLTVSQEAFLLVEGVIQHQEGVTHLKAKRVRALHDRSLPSPTSHDFH
jgi:error-prone DNA polymerase